MRIQTTNFGSGENLKCGIKNEKYCFDSHLHQYNELLIVLENEITVTVDKEKTTVRPGEAIFISPFKAHSYKSADRVKIWICVFSNSYINALVSDSELLAGWRNFKFKLSDGLFEYIKKKLPDNKELFVSQEKRTNRFYKALLFPIMEEFLSSAEPSEKRYRGDALTSILLYINSYAREDISRESVGAALGYHPAYVSRCISSLYNMNFRQLLNSFRIDFAMSLLKKTDFKMIDIALECGFSGERSFHRAFLAETGLTPGEYRKGDYI